jgi:hypothetical protein
MEKQISISEPATQLFVATIFLLFYVSLPFSYWSWLNKELERGAFPVDADSIGLPMAGFLVVWSFGFFVASAFTILIARQIKKRAGKTS